MPVLVLVPVLVLLVLVLMLVVLVMTVVTVVVVLANLVTATSSEVTFAWSNSTPNHHAASRLATSRPPRCRACPVCHALLGWQAVDLQRLIDSANAPILGIDQQGNVSEWQTPHAQRVGF